MTGFIKSLSLCLYYWYTIFRSIHFNKVKKYIGLQSSGGGLVSIHCATMFDLKTGECFLHSVVQYIKIRIYSDVLFKDKVKMSIFSPTSYPNSMTYKKNAYTKVQILHNWSWVGLDWGENPVTPCWLHRIPPHLELARSAKNTSISE